MTETVIEILKQFGLPVLLVLYFLWKDDLQQRTDRKALKEQQVRDKEERDSLALRVAEVEAHSRTKLEVIAENSAVALNHCAQALEMSSRIIQDNAGQRDRLIQALAENTAVLQGMKK